MSGSTCYPDRAAILNTLFDTLSHPIRREIIYYFEQTAEREDVSLANLVANIDERMPSATGDQLRLELVHTHLPKLEARDWLEYNPDTGRIRYDGHDRAKRLLGEVHAVF